ncbi:MAG: dihydrolipoyl dehydrogenase [Nitriliruptor sp.]|nr:MAG: dihydrolipoyl dehydrogenase [Nitriliruptor sp.]
MTDGRRHDVVVIGGGPGGYATAFRASQRGLDVALVEQDLVGGTCLHRGCIPSKAILHVAGVLDEVHRAEVLGLQVTSTGIDGAALGAFRDGVVTKLHKGLDHLASARTTRYHGRGRLRRDDDGHLGVEVTASDGEVMSLSASHVVLATGSTPKLVPALPVDGEVVQTSDQALWFTSPPERVVIIGGGAIGIEFASMWAPMGSHVTVVEALDRLLPLEDADSSAALAAAYRRRGIDVLTSAQVRGVAVEDGLASVDVEVDGDATTLTADRVLVAIGRAPNTAETGAGELGVLDERGFVVTDAYGATEVEGLWAVGDVRPTLALAHAAFAEGAVVGDRIAGVEEVRPVDHTHTPRVTYSHPEVASVGLTEAEARQRYGDEPVTTTTTNLRGNAKAIMAGSDGLVKLVHLAGAAPVGAPGDGGPVLGVHVVGPQATELIAAATLATAWDAVPAELAAITHAHPSLSEALGEAYLSAAGLPLHGA